MTTLVMEPVAFEFNPDQERGPDGKWEGTGAAKAPADAAVIEACTNWTYSGTDATRIRTEATNRDLIGDKPSSETSTLISAVEAAPPTTEPLYRGIAEPGTPEDVAKEYAVGTDLHIPLGSFSSDETQANKFAEWSRADSPENTEVIFKIDSGAQALSVPYDAFVPHDQSGDMFRAEKESIVRGDFTVTNVTPVTQTGYYEPGSDPRTALQVTLSPK